MTKADIAKLLKEARFSFSRSGGKGGQNVNKVETKAELVFNVVNSMTLNGGAKMMLLKKLAGRIDKEGNVRIYSQSERTQLGNRKKTEEKFIKLINNALKKVPVRIKTKKPESAKIKRLDRKKMQSEKKKARREKSFLDD